MGNHKRTLRSTPCCAGSTTAEQPSCITCSSMQQYHTINDQSSNNSTQPTVKLGASQNNGKMFQVVACTKPSRAHLLRRVAVCVHTTVRVPTLKPTHKAEGKVAVCRPRRGVARPEQLTHSMACKPLPRCRAKMRTALFAGRLHPINLQHMVPCFIIATLNHDVTAVAVELSACTP